MSTIKVSTIDTPTASDFAVKTASTTRLTISQSGHIGVRTASPLAPLHVSDLSAEIRITAPSITGADWGILPQTNNTTPLFRIFDRYNSLDRLTISSAGLVTATSFAGNGTIPIGGIIMWSGAIANIPTGWALCNGVAVGGITPPNLLDKFIVGAGSGYAVNATGGSTNIPQHSHFMARNVTDNNNDTKFGSRRNMTSTDFAAISPTAGAFSLQGDNAGSAGDNVDNAFASGGTRGLITSKSIVDQATLNLPPYYALAFIMRVA